jgi:diguanylate cyclase (GGDEF)-like protein
MRRLMRHYDTIGRYGGEEFLIVLPGCDAVEGKQIAERIREQISEHSVNTLEGKVKVTISLGVAAGDGSQKMDANALIMAADGALYRSKRKGRNRVSVATPAEIRRCHTTAIRIEPISSLSLADDPLEIRQGDRSPMG